MPFVICHFKHVPNLQHNVIGSIHYARFLFHSSFTEFLKGHVICHLPFATCFLLILQISTLLTHTTHIYIEHTHTTDISKVHTHTSDISIVLTHTTNIFTVLTRTTDISTLLTHTTYISICSVPVDFLRTKFRVEHTKNDVISILMHKYTYTNMYIIKKIISSRFISCCDLTS